MVNKRMHSNTINVLCDSNGNWLKERNGISNLLTAHFRTVSSTSNPIYSDGDFDVISSVITEADNVFLNMIPTDTKIENVVKSMPSWSSPGPDGFQAGFYETQWQIVGKDVIEVVKRSLLVAENHKIITGVKVSRKAPLISHFLFADDILIFGQANMQHVNDILKILENFGSLSGQMLNFDKSCVYFSHNLSPGYCEFLARALNISIVSDSEKYLGAPLLLGHSKVKYFDPIVKSFESRLKNFVSITLNQDGRSTLIKYVLNSSPTYQMRCFKIPTTLIDKLDSLQLNFCWRHKTGKGIKFISWDSTNKSKEQGGLGFRDLENFNIALIYHPPIPATGLLNTVFFVYVSDLFMENTKSWNVHLIYYLFTEECAEKILAMNVPFAGNDKLIWLPDRRGQFSVKSVYNVITKNTNFSAGTTVVSAQSSTAVYVIMLLKLVIIFLLTVLMQDLSGAKFVFGSGIIRVEINKTLMVTVWTIWKDRCAKVFDNRNPNRSLSVARINGLTILNCSSSNGIANPLQVQRWIPPNDGYLKINLDASFHKLHSHGGIGLIIRNFAGVCFGFQGEYINGGMKQRIEVEELECRAMLAAVTLARAKNLNKLVFESDSEVVVKSINEHISYVHWMNKHFILDIQFLLVSIRHWKCNSVRRDANGVADKLAKRARVTKT
ncbi:uncharacterized protein LOC113351266 [Papaver somniferum]|uniref:uncharacterized protein LOC113351266 n=1 Tax=Papaver somniferum TaxID=3469 RepID=UPI000E70157D|nr:uncharacterized protein LOC113351266 [Papaver somniferum]